MAITFIGQAKKQKNLILIFAFVSLITVIILLRGYFFKQPPEGEIILIPMKKIEINFEIFRTPLLNELQSFEKIPSTEETGIEIGRENPFTPY